MRHVMIFLVAVFAGVFAAVYWKNNRSAFEQQKPTVRVYASTSFIKQWGPGPWLKEKFEAVCDCRVEYLDGADSQILIERLRSDSKTQGADVVLGLDQYDLEMAQKSLEWKEINGTKYDYVDTLKTFAQKSPLIPYNWSVLAFVARQDDLKSLPKNFEDLLSNDFHDQISVQDPRTSSPGLQLLLWLIHTKGEDKAFEYLKQFQKQVRAFGSSWSISYGLFQKKQVRLTLSYVTSPLYHVIEEKDKNVIALEFLEGHPIQVEYIGIPETCKNCDLAQQFVDLVMSADGQKTIMEKNYMFPALRGVKDNTSFAMIPNYKLIGLNSLLSLQDRERVLKRWSQIRRAQ